MRFPRFSALWAKPEFSFLRFWGALAILLFFLGAFFNYAYYNFSFHHPNYTDFQSELNKREAYASAYLASIRQRVQERGLHSVCFDRKIFADSQDKDIVYFIFRHNVPVYWSSNAVDIRSGGEVPYDFVFYLITRNCYCIGVQAFDADYRYVALVKVKNKDANSNDVGNNAFVRGLHLPSYVSIVERTQSNIFQVKSCKGSYLFSLKDVLSHQHSPIFHVLCFTVWTAFLLVLFFILFRLVNLARAKVISRTGPLVLCFFSVLGLIFLSALQWPDVLFEGPFFSPLNYASSFSPSFGHLVLYTLAVLGLFLVVVRLFLSSSLFSFFARVDKWLLLLGGQLLSVLLFVLIYYLFLNLIYNSSLDVAVPSILGVSFITVAAIVLMLVWLVAFLLIFRLIISVYLPRFASFAPVFFCRMGWGLLLAVLIYAFGSPADWGAFFCFMGLTLLFESLSFFFHHISFFQVSLLAFVAINSVVLITYMHCDVRNSQRLQILADNLTDSQSLQQNRRAESLMEDISRYISSDSHLYTLLEDSSAARQANIEKYLLDTYFDSFWDKYEISACVSSVRQPFLIRKSNFGSYVLLAASFIADKCNRVNSSHFFLNTSSTLSLAYVGAFPFGKQMLYILFYPNLTYSNSFSAPGAASSLASDVSVVKYHDDEILYLSGSYHYPGASSWIPNVRHNSFHFFSADQEHFVSRFDAGRGMVVVSKALHRSYSYFIFVSYFCAVYFILALLIQAVHWRMRMKSRHETTIMGRMQTMFLIPLLVSFLVMGSLSVWFFAAQFQKRLVSEMSFRTASIQQNLQELMGLNSSIDKADQRSLLSSLSHLSTLFHTGIVVYDANGGQVASSHSSFLNERRRSASLMNPLPKFLMMNDFYSKETKHQTEFFSYYTRLYNRRNQLLGYVNVISSAEARQLSNEILNLVVVLIDLYLVVVVLLIFIIWFISKRFTQPITMLGLKLREIKLTGNNAKVAYEENDELGALVAQYNAMVDQLQLSAEKLAQSQREMAWRDMARRIAHEIKNPLTPMKLSVQMALRKKELDPEGFDDYFKKMAALLVEQIDNLSRIASQFSSFAKSNITTLEEVNLVDKLSSEVALFQNNEEGVLFSLNLNGLSQAVVRTDAQQILQVFNNLFRNAIQAIPEGRQGIVQVSLAVQQSFALVSIADNGCGVPPQNRQSIFVPNFTTKTSGNGLGLAIVKQIINLSNGEIWLESELRVGTTFYIRMPLASSSSPSAFVTVSADGSAANSTLSTSDGDVDILSVVNSMHKQLPDN